MGARFTKADVTRACGGVMQAGVSTFRVIIDPNGNLVIECSSDETLISKAPDLSELIERDGKASSLGT